MENEREKERNIVKWKGRYKLKGNGECENGRDKSNKAKKKNRKVVENSK